MSAPAAIRPILEVEQLIAGYSGHPVLHSVNLHVNPGEVVSLLGANGAGKSTLLKTIMGTVPVIQGFIRLDGTGIAGWVAHKRVAAGIGFSPEGRRVFANLSTEENLLMGAAALPRARKREGMAYVYHLFPVLAERARQKAGTLSGGEQQMLAIARTLMGNPVLLLLDEPSEGLAPIIVQRIGELLRQLRATGATVLIAEQNMHFCLGIASQATVIDKGQIVYSASIEDLKANENIRQRYLAL
jgi:branched-chain amino acid transport system ATP-binding protein